MNLKTKCHPEANGRKPQPGESAWTIGLPLENGDTLFVHMGKEGFERVGQFMLDMMADTPSYGDDSVDWSKSNSTDQPTN